MTQNALVALFVQRLVEAERVVGPMHLSLAEIDAAAMPMGRSYAYFSPRDRQIVVCTKYLTASSDRIDAVLRHELGHAADFLGSRFPALPLDRRADPACHVQGNERRADALAEAIWQQPLYYDPDTVQALHGGTRPRPEKLGL